ncbi:sensor histidine kinase [Nonomuraea gerenzanensis]|uniref:sensor histidine kinase n=1 Tax=Nonomuraea gerenzanensis TaxID=93944 RepID=UPI001CD95730|nr:ATP-binding protein [Nonomuraea gerenzanensis]UBU18157.1 nitrate- and nitrite sensing domain-containing protein [Nonomuraea gerenzanensis]
MDEGGEPRGPAGVRRLKLRTVLLIIVLVPSLTFTPLLASGMNQLFSQWRAEQVQMDLATSLVGKPASELFFTLNTERRLTAELQAGLRRSAADELTTQRAATDRAIKAFLPLADLDTADGPEGLTAAITRTTGSLGRLAEQRRAVDAGWAAAQRSYDYYSGVIESAIGVLTVLSQTDEGEVNNKARLLVDLFWIVDTFGREDALLARGWESKRLTTEEYRLVSGAIGARRHLLQSRVLPNLTGNETRYAGLMNSQAWQTLTVLEGQFVTPAGSGVAGQVTLRGNRSMWRSSADAVTQQVVELLRLRLANVTAIGYGHADMIFTVFVSISSVGLLALGLVIFTSWRLTRTLRRRIDHLRQDAHELQERLPDVVARLERGQDVDVDAEAHMIEPTQDELGELGHALNLARRSAVTTAVRQAEQHRGFQRMLQRIARRTQILIGLQLKKLDELERKHEDPEVLEGLFDLDHLTARLRRYEENLVILGGGQPQRRWRRPVPLLDVLRAAQGEVQDYRRISIDVEGTPWVAARAVGPLVHVLAEVMENATTFSKPNTPVEVRAAPVSRGVAVEIEDRGLGMEPEQYAAANDLMAAPPELDVMTHAEDARLGLYVVARLSATLGLHVELRSSPYGGTRVIVLLPETIVVEAPPPDPEEPVLQVAAVREPGPAQDVPHENGQLPARSRGRALAQVTAPAGTREPDDEPRGRAPLPQRVRQASLAPELRVPAEAEETPGQDTGPLRDQPRRSGATIGAFQRQSRRRRTGDDAYPTPPDADPEPGTPTTEDR